MRLDKYIANQTPLSRSEAVKAIRSGRVTVDSSTVREAKTQVKESSQAIALDGKEIGFKENIYLMLNKPADYISSTEDRNHKTVIELLPEEYSCRNPFPCGRLDIDTTGLVILTDDGAWAHNITSPKKKCFKTYIVDSLRTLSDEEIKSLEDGVFLAGDERITKPAKVKVLDECRYELQISEGRFHQVKRMFETVGNKVLKLHRHAIGEIQLDNNLAPGEFRELNENEVNFFK